MLKKTTVWGKRGEYTIYMTFAKAEKALEPRFHEAQIIAWIYATALVIMAVGQLFSFEDFIPYIRDLHLTGGEAVTVLFACLIVIAEVFALPFLLRMPLSSLMRWFGLGFSLFVPLAWLFVTILTYVTQPPEVASSMLGAITGTKIAVPNIFQLILAGILLILAVVSAAGLWPAKKKK